MSETLRCHDCGHENPAGSENCAACNFPLRDEAPPVAGAKPGPGTPDIPRPTRPRRAPPASGQSLTLWLVFGVIVGAIAIFTGYGAVRDALKVNRMSAGPPVEGSNRDEQQKADELRAILAKDSTNVDARVGLADILYDTKNWPEAIIHYRSAVHHDSTRTTAIVDLGVCYFNLSDSREAERLFNLALTRDPHQTIALYNLGIVNESRSRPQEALKFFHRALQSQPDEKMRQHLVEAMQRIMQQLGKTAPPLDGMAPPGAGGPAPPGGR